MVTGLSLVIGLHLAQETITIIKGLALPDRLTHPPYLMDIRTKLAHQIGDATVFDCCFEWSPDGHQLFYVASIEGLPYPTIWNWQTGTTHHLEMSNFQGGEVRWSLDSQSLFLGLRRDSRINLFRFGVNDGEIQQLTFSKDKDVFLADAALGGQFLALQVMEYRTSQIYRVQSDGSSLQRLTDTVGSNLDPRIAPDGQRIVFLSERTGNYEVFTMNADGSHQRQLTYLRENAVLPIWSPDGTQILFETGNTTRKIYVMNADGSNLHPIAQRTIFFDEMRHVDIAPPLWTPDSQQIIFDLLELNYTKASLYIVNADGTNLNRLYFDTLSRYLHPAWQPGT